VSDPKFRCDFCRRLLPASELIVGAYTVCLDCIESDVCDECQGRGTQQRTVEIGGLEMDVDDARCWCCDGTCRIRLPMFLRAQA